MRQYLLLLLSLSMMTTACQSDNNNGATTEKVVETYSENTPKVAFVCEQISFDEALPESALYVTVNDNKIKLTNIPTCETYSKSDYENYDIPNAALAAAGGYFAGLGEYFYAVLENGKINIMAGWMDEMQEEGGFHYDRMATFQDGRITFKGMESKPDLTGLYTLGGHDNSYVLFLGMKNDTLTAQYAEIEGMLPPAEDMAKYMSSFNFLPVDFDVNMDNLSFTSDLGAGRFQRTSTNVLVSFYEKENPMTGGELTLNKMK